MENIFNRCIAGEHRDKYTITAKIVYEYCVSPYSVWCKYFAPKEEMDPVNPYLHLLSDRARKQKQRIQQKFSDAEEIDAETFTSGFMQTLKKCADGTETILNAPLFYLPENIFGICDAIKKDTSNKSIFGAYHYRPILIKNAKRIKHEHIIQAAFYNYLLGIIQQYTPPEFSIMNREGKEYKFEYDRAQDELMTILKGIKDIQNGKEISPTAKVCKWPWTTFCTRQAIEKDDISIVPMIGPTLKKELNEQGIKTVKELAARKIHLDIPDAMLEKIKKHAQAYVEGKPQVLMKPKLPESKTELYIDIEGTDEMDMEEGSIKVDYLIGILVLEQGKEKYQTFISKDLKGEEKMYKELFRFLQNYQGTPIYHYGPYERLHLRLLAEQYGIKMKMNLIDILTIIKKCTAFPTISQSLKDIAGYLGFKWRGTISAQESIVLYLNYLETKDEQLLKQVIRYNEDDVRATRAVKDFLAKI